MKKFILTILFALIATFSFSQPRHFNYNVVRPAIDITQYSVVDSLPLEKIDLQFNKEIDDAIKKIEIKEMVYLILIAGGVGNRLGAGIPKQFVEVLGKPIIAYTMELFQNHPEIDGIELVCVDGYQDELRKIADNHHISKVIKIVKGGSEYERSIMNGVEGLKGIAKPNDVVIIHWAASPFVTDEIISDNIRVCKEKGNAMSACPAYLLYGSNDGEQSKKNINRDTIKILAAPQSFLYKNIVDIYKEVEKRNLFESVEAHTTAFMTALGIPIYFSKGSQTNIKITTKEDLELFTGYVLAQKYKSGKIKI